MPKEVKRKRSTGVKSHGQFWLAHARHIQVHLNQCVTCRKELETAKSYLLIRNFSVLTEKNVYDR